MCIHRINLIETPSPAQLLLALGMGDPAMKVLVLPDLDLSNDANITPGDVDKIIDLFRQEIRKDKNRKERRYAGLDLLVKFPPDDLKLGAGDSPTNTKALNSVQQLFHDRTRQHNADLFAGDLTINQWRERVRDEIKTLHVGSGVSGAGGRWDDMGFDDWGYVGNRVRREYGFLDQLSEDVRAGKRSQKWLDASMGRYSETASSTFEAVKVNQVGIDTTILRYFPGDGTTVCRSNCQCRWDIRVISRKRGDFNATWKLGGVIDHCPTCVARSRQWRALKIRGGKMVSIMPEITR